MKPHHLSASKVDLAVYGCSYWARGEVEHPQRPSGKAAMRGTAVHKASELHHLDVPITCLDEESRPLWETLRGWLAARPVTYASELPLLYDATHDVAGVCRVGPASDRDYLDVHAMAIPMRLDLVRQVAPGTVEVVDIKTGARSNVAPAAENLQLRTQAVAAGRHYGAERVRVGFVFPLITKIHEDWAELDADALDAHAGVLHRTLKLLPESQPERGAHCWKCPIGPTRDYAATCPAWANNEEDVA